MNDKAKFEHKEIVTSLINSKAVDFEAIGRAVAEMGPSRSVALEPWDEFCWTMRHFIRLYRIPDPRADLGDLGNFRDVAGNLRG